MVYTGCVKKRQPLKIVKFILFKVFHYQKITIYPVLKNFRHAILKVFLIDPGYYFSEKYIEKTRIKWKILFIKALPWANKSDGLAYSIVSFFCCIVSYNFMTICKIIIVVFLREQKISLPLLSCKMTQKVMKLTWYDFRGWF